MYENLFERAVANKTKISFQLARSLHSNNEQMPEGLCQLLKMPIGSSYSEGVKKYNRVD